MTKTHQKQKKKQVICQDTHSFFACRSAINSLTSCAICAPLLPSPLFSPPPLSALLLLLLLLRLCLCLCFDFDFDFDRDGLALSRAGLRARDDRGEEGGDTERGERGTGAIETRVRMVPGGGGGGGEAERRAARRGERRKEAEEYGAEDEAVDG